MVKINNKFGRSNKLKSNLFGLSHICLKFINMEISNIMIVWIENSFFLRQRDTWDPVIQILDESKQ